MMKKRLLTILALAGLALGQQAMAQQVRWTADNGNGMGLPGDVRLTKDINLAEEFMWQDYLDHEFMLMSTRTHTYIGKSPTTGSPYSMDFKGADPARKNGAVFRWE